MVHVIIVGGEVIGQPACGGLDGVVAEVWEGGEICCWGEAGGKGGHHGHVCEIEATGSAGGEGVVIHGEVAIAVCVGPGGGDVGRVEDIGVDEVKLVAC